MADRKSYDIVIIGGGPGGYVCAIRAAQLGFSVGVVEKRDTLGGTCLNVGCIPSKALLHSSHLFAEARHGFAAQGIKAKVELDLPTMLKRKDGVVDQLTKGVAFLFKKNKIEHLKGTGAITGKSEVTINGKTKVGAKHIIIATGSDVAPLPGVEIDEKTIVSSTGALALPKVPKKMVVVGAGYIGLEMGSVWSRLGAEVTVVEFLDRITPGMDGEVAKTFKRILEKQGLTFKLGMKVTGAKPGRGGVSLTVEPAKGKGDAETLKADVVLVAIGRRPYTEGLGLDKVGVELDERGFVKVDAGYRTTAEGVYAIGDAIPGPMLAHKAEEEGVVLAELLAGEAGHMNYETVPGIVYTVAGGRLGRQDRGAAQGRRRRLPRGQVPVLRQQPRHLHRRHRRLRQDPRRCQDRPHPRRPHHRAGGGRHDPRGHRPHGIRRLGRGPGAQLPRPPDLQRGRARGRAGGGQARAADVMRRA